MEEMTFKKIAAAGIFSYLHIDNQHYQSPASFESNFLNFPVTRAVDRHISSAIFQYYLSVIEYCTGSLQKYCVVSPSLALQVMPIYKVGPVPWRYELLADDQNGIGIDNGFIEAAPGLHLFGVKSFLQLNGISEDIFGEEVYSCSLLGLHTKSTDVLSVLMSTTNPHLPSLLQPGEIFVHVTVSKEIGYYNAMLIKTRHEIDTTLRSFFNILDPNN